MEQSENDNVNEEKNVKKMDMISSSVSSVATTDAKTSTSKESSVNTSIPIDKNTEEEKEDDSKCEQPPIEKLSKNQLRKRKKKEYMEAKKKRKKLQDKEVKRQRALAAGRDLDAERKQQEENQKLGLGRKRREELWLKKMKSANNSFKVCIDCSYEEHMTPKEINSLSQQIRYCYASNRKSTNPVYFSVANLSGATLNHMKDVCGFPDQWLSRAFSYSSTKSVIEMHTNNNVEDDNKKDNDIENSKDEKSKLIYLTSDSTNVLEHLDDSKVYIIGGIVDRNRLKRAAITKAEKMGVATAKLPLDDYFKLVTTKVLTCNHVFEILLKYRELGNDWKKAMLDVLPVRKDIQVIGNKEDKDVQKKSLPECDKDEKDLNMVK